MSSVATVMLVNMVGEAGGLELAVLAGEAGAVLGGLLVGVARLGCSCGLVSHEHRVSGPVAVGDVNGVRGFVGIGIDPTPLGVPSWDIPTATLVTSVSWAPTALVVLAYGCFKVVGVGWSVSAGTLRGDGRSGRTLALRVNAKLGTLPGLECILLPRVHDELGGSQQTLQRRLGRIGRILLEGLLQIALEHSVGAIILARVTEVGQGRDELLGG